MIGWDSLKHDRKFDTLSSTAILRIKNERKRIIKEKEELNKNGIYFNWGDNEIIERDYYQLLVGPHDTPYAGGFFFFQGKYPDEYPYKSMCMRAHTQGGSIRSHPNFYVNGYVCLSLFGTWSGEPWSSTQNTISVAYTVQSMFMNNPIQCEPGHTNLNLKDPKALSYHNSIIWWTLRYAVIEMMENTPPEFLAFKEDMKTIFVKNMPIYLESLNKLSHLKNNSNYVLDFYSGNYVFNRNFIEDKLNDIYKTITGITYKNSNTIVNTNTDTNIDTITNTTTNTNTITTMNTTDTKNINVQMQEHDNQEVDEDEGNEEIKINKSKTLRPKIPPKCRNPGDKIELEDGSVWVIKLYESGVKRWIRDVKK